MSNALRPYFKNRDFTITSEPKGGAPSKAGRLSFVIQKHAASQMHYDFRPAAFKRARLVVTLGGACVSVR